MEEWKDIEGYEGLYQISNLGRVKSLPRNDKFYKRAEEIILKTFKCGSGYQEVILHKDRKRKPKLIHRLVAEAFILNQKNRREVNHKDGNKANNTVSNLEWVTPSENQRHSIDVLKNTRSKTKKVICVETNEVFLSLKSASDKYNLKAPLIWKCCNNKQRTTGGYHWEYINE
jgi:hypothetical protein